MNSPYWVNRRRKEEKEEKEKEIRNSKRSQGCLICKRMINKKNKYQLCSSCQSASIGDLIKEKKINLEQLINLNKGKM